MNGLFVGIIVHLHLCRKAVAFGKGFCPKRVSVGVTPIIACGLRLWLRNDTTLMQLQLGLCRNDRYEVPASETFRVLKKVSGPATQHACQNNKMNGPSANMAPHTHALSSPLNHPEKKIQGLSILSRSHKVIF
jgi:hypothetical protein